MIRTKQEQTVEFKCIRGGNGEAEMRKITIGDAELYGKGRMFNHMVLAPGNSIGEHTHTGDNEIFYFLSGTGTYNDNGTIVTVHPGDTTICSSTIPVFRRFGIRISITAGKMRISARGFT